MVIFTSNTSDYGLQQKTLRYAGYERSMIFNCNSCQTRYNLYILDGIVSFERAYRLAGVTKEEADDIIDKVQKYDYNVIYYPQEMKREFYFDTRELPVFNAIEFQKLT